MARSQKLSKAARNERAKLKATFFNNVAVGVLLSGYFVPLFAIWQRIEPHAIAGKGPIDFFVIVYPWPQSFGFITTVITASMLAFVLHCVGLLFLKKVED